MKNDATQQELESITIAHNKVDQNMGMEEAPTFAMRFIANTSFVSLFVTRKTFISFEGNGEA